VAVLEALHDAVEEAEPVRGLDEHAEVVRAHVAVRVLLGDARQLLLAPLAEQAQDHRDCCEEGRQKYTQD
jgi:hypothetical protein